MKRFLLFFSFLLPIDSEAVDDPNFNEHIAPLIHENCTECHRPGEAGPFSLITYKDIFKRARMLDQVISDRYMPPWHPVHGTAEYSNSRRLSDEQIELFAAWLEAGKPEGDPDKAPVPPSFPKGWQLGEPDLVVTMAKAYPVPADGRDIYRNFVLPLDLPEDKWVKAVELRPSARSVVHHSLFFLDSTGSARKMDGKDGKPGFNGMGFQKSGSLGGYVPGSTPKKFPGDLALPLPKGADLVLATHFHPSGKAEMEQTKVGFFFADKPPSVKLETVQVPPGFGRGMKIDIPAGESNYKVEDTFRIPVDVKAIQVSGHAHYIAQDMKMVATLPDGRELILLHIDDWDLDWQDNYIFAEPILLSAGTVLKTTIIYDNSAGNPDNPFSPPQRIKWGRESTDEMGSVTLMVVPDNSEKSRRLSTANKLNQVKILAQVGQKLRNSRVLDRLPQIVENLDKNTDGLLQSGELPARMRKPLIDKLDEDGNDALDSEEIETLRQWLRSMKKPQEEI